MLFFVYSIFVILLYENLKIILIFCIYFCVGRVGGWWYFYIDGFIDMFDYFGCIIVRNWSYYG